MSKLKKAIPYATVALSVYVFYAFVYGATLRYSEQYQLFQSTADYLAHLLARPGGLAMYIGRFLTQFFIAPPIGAFFVSLLATAVFACVTMLLKSNRYRWQLAMVVTALPICALLDRQSLFNGPVCMLIGCTILLVFSKIKQNKLAAILLPILTFATYWIAGGLPATFVAGYCFCSSIVGKHNNKTLFISSLTALLIVVASPFVARQLFGVQLNPTRAFLGADYSRLVVYSPKLLIAATILIAILPLLDNFLNNKLLNLANKLKSKFLQPSLTCWIFAVFAVGLIFTRMVNFKANRRCEIDFCARTQDWKRIIKIAEKNPPTDDISIAYVNLALTETNRLGDKMFSYEQIGPTGLIPDFEIDDDIPMVLSEIYYHLGLTNFAERFAFEAAKASPDYQESARAVKRLAETSIIKGNYPLARKYLTMLCNTTFYVRWAQKSLRLIDSGRTDENAEWARMRNLRITEDYYYVEKEKDMMLHKVLAANPSNRIAYEYLMTYYLLNKDLESFMQYADFGGRFYGIAYPRAFREAAIFHLRMTNPDAVKDFGTADRQMLDQFYNFGKIYNTNRHDARLAARFGDTYWYYLFKEE